MSGKVGFQFPDQKAIVAFFNAHPSNTCFESEVIKNNFPDSAQKVAKCFADKTILRNQVDKILQSTFSDTVLMDKNFNELSNLKARIAQFSKGNDSNIVAREWTIPGLQTSYALAIHAEQDWEELKNVVITLYNQVLFDLQQGATYKLTGEQGLVTRQLKPF